MDQKITTTTSTWTFDVTSTPESNPFIKKVNEKLGKQQAKWRQSVLACTLATTVVFVLNLIVTLFLATNPQRKETPGRYTIYTGDCKTVSRLNSGLHLIINALSTILLSSSNYCMQCLSAPTRKEIDKAHQKQRRLDIGIMSFRNLRFIDMKRVSLWWILAISSFPLHLLYGIHPRQNCK